MNTKNQSLCNMLILLTYVIPALDEMMGDNIQVSFDSDTRFDKPYVIVNLETDSGDWVRIIDEPRNGFSDEHYFTAMSKLFLGDAELSESYNPTPTELHKDARRFAGQLAAKLREGIDDRIAEAEKVLQKYKRGS